MTRPPTKQAVQCPEFNPHAAHRWGAGDHALCPGVTWAAYFRAENRAKLVGRTASYNGRRVTVIDADDSGCAQIALWVNRDQLEVDSEPTHKDGGHNNGCCCVCQFGGGVCWPSVCCHEVAPGR